MTEDKEKGKILIFPKKDRLPSPEECFAKAKDLMARADAVKDLDRKAQMLREAGEWLKLAETKR
ncbi:hypothetical protein GJW-30_1_00565 [Variibacter gotjawalensis]|uniref:Uncharacterized protein n=1 Tax=Variibacter gotjawalensis TaxID=1333996 RepID=A0A0S3PQ92_9BRAD|nr:hypothetical protein [Variibacter gotjawalensis]NIK48350.1 hypothetical protein [Variibacter gotjawalensis]RZS50220.1 hypothetical protein EV661_2675 [Variibacter gotjawalensis]BAT58051.1 hypothetical protein GJW-30_1_00565 [Variibacter gotjawalensis]